MCKCVSQSNLVWSLDCLEMQRCNPMRKVAVWSCHMNVRPSDIFNMMKYVREREEAYSSRKPTFSCSVSLVGAINL
ncbi:uncharacterized protein LOC112463541 isoform X2 [Temnothorax curvispinosus]|uniref:Uncharacterized protein LOC112463541 isoform X2 n=1 Tax=Temnothorax curvispinosus TaxID=300111 RepID=A0A6J1QV49_9HYME|nr:uncharacterized protein LOC112463541 isoform X2 [Temnothorax curvispinosus]